MRRSFVTLVPWGVFLSITTDHWDGPISSPMKAPISIIRYTPSGEVVCTIGSGRILVEDTGPGIPEAELAQVMDRHYRGEGVSGKGSGLGLAIVQRLCELYGWSIHFENRKQGGLRAELKFFGTI